MCIIKLVLGTDVYHQIGSMVEETPRSTQYLVGLDAELEIIRHSLNER